MPRREPVEARSLATRVRGPGPAAFTAARGCAVIATGTSHGRRVSTKTSHGFEPAHGKGAAARAAFYVLLRYSTEISPSELPPERLRMLLGWHNQDPVSDWARHRNAAIFARQGNRNPFIDHPEWAAVTVTLLQA